MGSSSFQPFQPHGWWGPFREESLGHFGEIHLSRPLSEELHQKYHDKVQKFAWHNAGEEYYRNMNPEKRLEIFDKLFRTTKEFDAEFGTKLYDGMIREMNKVGFLERGMKW